ncbi:MAG: hypothetical protein ACR2LZ_07555 [Pyrinomonadaceae bacterium]
MVTEIEYQQILDACHALPRTINNYLENDFIMNLFSTVLDYQMVRTTLANAESHYKENHWHKIRTRDDLANFLAKYPNTKEGNVAAAQYLWGYKYWTRLQQLRGLLVYFDSVGVTDQEGLRRWANESDFDRDFRGKIKGLSFAIYKWLVMRQGIPSVKADSNVRKFLTGITKHTLSDREAVDVLERVAKDLGIPANELDWSIWDYQSNKK